MTDVISFRTEREDELKKLANQKSISLSQLTSEIVSEYLDFYILTTKLDMIRDTKKTISTCFELTADSDLKTLWELDAKEVTQSFETMINDFSFEKLTNLMRSWFMFNNFSLEEFDENTHIKFVSKNIMSKNWNIHQSHVFVKMYQNFRFDGIIDKTEKNLLIFKISKTKSL